MILICYDGSDDAKGAVQSAGVLFKGDRAVVLTVWESLVDLLTRTPGGFGFTAGAPTDEEQVDEASRTRAQEKAQEGTTLAREGGIDATAKVCARSGTIAETILSQADEINADAIVLGSRGLGGVGSLLIGSTSHAVIQSADRTVVTVPSPKVAQRRHDKRREHAESAA